MIKTFHVENFKSLVNFTAEFNEVTALVGINCAGKSTVLQAMHFICDSVKEDYEAFLQKRYWKVDNIKSKLIKSNKMKFVVTFDVTEEDGEVIHFCWNTEITVLGAKNELRLNYEYLSADDERLVEYDRNGHLFVTSDSSDFGGEIYFGDGFVFRSSVLKNLGDSKDYDPRIALFVKHLNNFMSFELLNPDNMRQSSRGNSDMIEATGKNLPSFIKKMSPEQKMSFMNKITWLLDDKVSDVDTVTTRPYNWTQITVKETYKNAAIKITSRDLSDGMLRLIAIIAISEIQKDKAIFLFDEVENGINAHYVEKIIKLFNEMSKAGHQIIFTTHSSLFMDYMDPDSVLLLSRNDDGYSKAIRIFDDEKMKKRLKYMYPGELLLNLDGMNEINQ